MFILRRLTNDGQESNEVMGDYYNIVREDHSPKSFDEIKAREKYAGDIYAFIICREGTRTVPLYKNSTYYMMLSNGQTFANMTFS